MSEHRSAKLRSEAEMTPINNRKLDSSEHGVDDDSNMACDEDTERLRLLKIRKKQELKLIKRFDKQKINVSKECWFLIDSDWLNKWSSFVNGDENEDSPGMMSSKELLDGKFNPLPNLCAVRDYRAVPPIVYFIFLELYGKDSSPEICRYQIDIYKAPVTIAKMVNIQLTGRAQAKIQVNRVRPKWIKWDRGYDDDDQDQPLGWCCGLTKEHLEAFIYWAITCWSNRKRNGRGDISYRQYQPLKPDKSTLEEDDDGDMGNEGEGQMSVEDAQLNDEDWLEARRATETNTNTGNSDGHSVKTGKASAKKGGRRAKRVPRPDAADRAEAAAAAAERARSQYFLKSSEANGDDSDSSSDSDTEGQHILGDGPADRGVEQGTWWHSFSR